MGNGNGNIEEVQFEELTDVYISRAAAEFNTFVAPVATEVVALPVPVDAPATIGTSVNPSGWDQSTAYDYKQIKTQIDNAGEAIAKRCLQDIPEANGGSMSGPAITESTTINNTPGTGLNDKRITEFQTDAKNIWLASGLTPPFPWCASAVSWWWGFGFQDARFDAGKIKTFLPGTGPTCNSNVSSAGNTYVPRWEYWAKETRRFTRLPGVGYACLYGNAGAPYATHIGVVVSVESNLVYTVVCGNDGTSMTGAPGGDGVRIRRHNGISGTVGFIAPIPFTWNGATFS
jgi:hypothetical protein